MKTASLGSGLDIDVAQLVKSRLLVQANSGGGKSWTLRRLCEQTFGLVQHIIIDPESEFYTLREKHDYALFGKGGDGPADLKSAPLLARRLLELSLSAVVDISELGVRRPAFVKAFLEALVAVPRELWHPVLVIVDEAHKFCPEKGRGESESTAAVIDLMTVGRKRGFCGVLATQRVSKLNKDAAAECNNKLIGRCSLDVDRKRASEELGFTDKRAELSLRDLEAGEFYAWGPALSKDIMQVKIGKVMTTHPEAGEVAPPPAPPRAKVKKLLDELINLPREAEVESKNVGELQVEVRRLRAELKKVPTPKTEVIKELTPLISYRQVAHLEKTAKRITADTDRLEKAAEHLDRMRDRLAQAQQAIVSELGNLKTEIQMQSQKIEKSVLSNLPPSLRGAAQMIAARPPKIGAPPAIGAQKHPPATYVTRPRPTSTGDTGLNPARQRVLDTITLLNRLQITMTRDTLAAWYGVHPNNKGFTNNLGVLRSSGYLNDLVLTETGASAAQDMPIPSVAELHEKILAPLNTSQRKIMEVLVENDALEREQLAEILDVHPNNKGLTNNIGKLRSRQLATKGWPIKAGDVMRLQGA